MVRLLRARLGASLLLIATTGVASPGATVSSRPSRNAAVRPATVHRGGLNRPSAFTQYCVNGGPLSFVGGGFNFAGGPESGILSGLLNQACGHDEAVGAGFQNAIFASPDWTGVSVDPFGSYIGAGSNNQMHDDSGQEGDGSPESIGCDADVFAGNVGQGCDSFIGAGDSNMVVDGNSAILAGHANQTGYAGFVGAGDSNEAFFFDGFVGSGAGNVVISSFVGAGLDNHAGVSPDALVPQNASFVGAGSQNVATVDSFVGAGAQNQAYGAGAFVGAGGLSFLLSGVKRFNVAGGDGSFIGAGDGNVVNTSVGFIGAGTDNTIQTTSTGGTGGATFAVINGGFQNLVNPVAKNGAQYGVIAGGDFNVVSGTSAAIGGGFDNAAGGGAYALIPGGYENVAKGYSSFASGVKAGALNNGAFVWSDGSSTANSLNSSGSYQFLARAAGGFFLYSNPEATSGVELAPGSGAWASLSDRSMKEGVAPLDEAAILERVASLPVSEWSYRSERGVRHVGPMAQDFYAAFHVGADDRHITSIDEDGVALAAIKALHARNAALYERNATLRTEGAGLRRDLSTLRNQSADLRAELAGLEIKVASLSHKP